MLSIRIRGCFLHALGLPTGASYNFSQVCKSKALALPQLVCWTWFALPKCHWTWNNLKPLVSQKLCTLSKTHLFYFPLSNSKPLIFVCGKLKHNCKCISISSYSTEPNNQKADHNKTPIQDLTKSHVENDAHDVTSILKEIKDDFNDSENKPSELSSDGETTKQKSTKMKELPAMFSGIQFEESEKINTEFQYDYRVAEDIEEYDYKDEQEIAQQMVRPEKVLPISLKRGQTGVFDLEELLVFLNHLGAENIVTLPIPYEANFCDHMVIASAKSRRHLMAMNEEFLWVHKRRRSSMDPSLNIEGLGKSDWSALDLGNIVLHIFYGDSREHYDIESLWTLGPENDPKCKEQNQEDIAMSAESLFWLETAKKSGTDDKVENTQENESSVNSQKTSS